MSRRIITQLHYISQYASGDLILQSHIKALNPNKLPPKLKADIQLLKEAAAYNEVVSLSSNQIRMRHRMFAILNSSLIQPGKWINYENVEPHDYRVIVNPILVRQSSLRLKDFEECPSIPGLRFHIWNPVSQSYKFLSPNFVNEDVIFKEMKQDLKGFQSRIWDHQVRHLEGILALDPKISNIQLSVSDDYQEIPAVHELAQNLRKELNFTSEENFMKFLKKQKNMEKKEPILDPNDIPEQITKEMKGRMSRNYRKIKKVIDSIENQSQK